ncbi:MAG: hypothetical protein H0W42_00960 [Gemmatimonadaceae bacterium]|nr:hypothetical protein [Gemmatimonadaceae bacterium]
MRTLSRSFGSAAAAAALLFAACYKLVPVAGETPSGESQVVLEFTDAGAEQLGGVLGAAIISARGRPLAWTADTIALAMIATTRRTGEEQFWKGDRVAIPRGAVARIYERRLDRGKTALFAVTGAAIAFGAQQVIRGSGSGVPRPPNRGPGQ